MYMQVYILIPVHIYVPLHACNKSNQCMSCCFGLERSPCLLKSSFWRGEALNPKMRKHALHDCSIKTYCTR